MKSGISSAPSKITTSFKHRDLVLYSKSVTIVIPSCTTSSRLTPAGVQGEQNWTRYSDHFSYRFKLLL